MYLISWSKAVLITNDDKVHISFLSRYMGCALVREIEGHPERVKVVLRHHDRLAGLKQGIGLCFLPRYQGTALLPHTQCGDQFVRYACMFVDAR